MVGLLHDLFVRQREGIAVGSHLLLEIEVFGVLLVVDVGQSGGLLDSQVWLLRLGRDLHLVLLLVVDEVPVDEPHALCFRGCQVRMLGLGLPAIQCIVHVEGIPLVAAVLGGPIHVTNLLAKLGDRLDGRNHRRPTFDNRVLLCRVVVAPFDQRSSVVLAVL